MPAVDSFSEFSESLTAPASNAAVVTPNDSADLGFVTRAIYVGGTGNIAVVTKGGQTVTIPTVPAGTTLRIRASRVMATNTTATGIVALW